MKSNDKKGNKAITKKLSTAKKKFKLNVTPSQKDTEKSTKSQKPLVTFPIVGIGASAGGLEAIELFLKNIPDNCNMAFVFVQHLDPTHKDLIVEILQPSTSMKVIQVKDNMRIQVNCFYVIPPDKDMSIHNGVLHLLDRRKSRGLHLPIDSFFRSLADDQRENSIGVILSGMGSDGTLGLKAIKENTGVVYVQEPADAKFDSMPRSAIDEGLADVIAKVEELPAKIAAHIKHAPNVPILEHLTEGKTPKSLEKILFLLKAQTGHDFSQYKGTTLYRRIERRMNIHQIDKITSYVRLIQENPYELEILFKELLIGVTNFFRDQLVWDELKNKILIPLIKGLKQNYTLRAWVPACSTGEEAYTLAIIFREALEKVKPGRDINLQIFATDIDINTISKAREGVFPLNIAADVSNERLKKFFIERKDGYEISKTIREMIIFAPHNIIKDPPFTKLDILSCRNLLIYFTPVLQKKLIPLFHYALNPDGILVLGSSETIGEHVNMFKPAENKLRIYRRLNSLLPSERITFPSQFAITPGAIGSGKRPLKPAANIHTMTEQILLQEFAPAAVLVNSKGDIIYISGRTGKYIEPAAGKANWNIHAMARPGIRYELSNAFQKAVSKEAAIKIKNIFIDTENSSNPIEISIKPLQAPEELKGMVIIVFSDVATVPVKNGLSQEHTTQSSDPRIKTLVQELARTRQEALAINQEMQTVQEEFKSANEELQSANEELQSANEEMTTSKEEMQSMNEELQTVNQELHAKMEELSQTNNDMKNLLDSTDIATLFLDNSLHIKRFTQRTTEITKLISSDVGRPITDIASDLFYLGMEKDLQQVLKTLISLEKEVSTSTGKWFLARIHPYRTLENMIDGVVVTYSEITVLKDLEAQLLKAQSVLEKKFDKQTEELGKVRADIRLENVKTGKTKS